MIKCPECQRELPDDTDICICGKLLDNRAATRTFNNTDYEEGTPKWGSARFGSRTNLLIGVEGEVDTFIFDAEQIDELLIGRSTANSEDVPEIDLAVFEAVDKGISRQHALIIRRDGSLYLVDNNSSNGTFLNGQKVVPQQPRVLRDGDDIRLGHLVMRITFAQAD